MKWHNVGGGKIQIRLLVAMLNGDAFLCDAYNKNSLIYAGRHTIRGKR